MHVLYNTEREALDSTTSFSEERKRLAAMRPGNVLVARIDKVHGQFTVSDVKADSELDWNQMSNYQLVTRADGITCPVCGKSGELTGTFDVPGVAAGNVMTGLDPDDGDSRPCTRCKPSQ